VIGERRGLSPAVLSSSTLGEKGLFQALTTWSKLYIIMIFA
jgi:hypothetical protein